MATVDGATIEALAKRLRDADTHYAPIAPIRDELPPGDIESAYAVQLVNTEFALRSGERIVGHKIGLTSSAIQARLGVNEPDFGILFESLSVPPGSTFAHDQVLLPRVEAEVAVILGGALEDPASTFDDVSVAVDHVRPALEIVGSRIRDWDIGIVDTVADNASSGIFCLGETAVDPAGFDLAAAAAVTSIDGRVVAEGSGATCMGHPFNAVLWLAKRMIANGTPLQPGEVIMSGALSPMVDFGVGTTAHATIEGLGEVAITRGTPPR